MDEKTLAKEIKYLVDKYVNDGDDLVKLAVQDSDSVKYVLAEISKRKQRKYEERDMDIIKSISFYYL